MSRIGKMPITVPGGVKIDWQLPKITVKGPKATLTRMLHPKMLLEITSATIIVTPKDDSKECRALWGLTRTLVNNMVVGVTSGYTKILEMTGVGWRAEVAGQTLKLSLGFSHPVNFPLPQGIQAEVDPKSNKITLTGANKEVLGEVAAKIRALRKPEPYKGKGIRYQGEHIIRKVGKAGSK